LLKFQSDFNALAVRQPIRQVIDIQSFFQKWLIPLAPVAL
jgi:hypothetical protein